MKNIVHVPSRRQFIQKLLFGAFAFSFFGSFEALAAKAKKSAEPAPLPAGAQAVLETDPVATAIGYRADIKKIDYVKYPQRKKPEAKTQFCKTCALYTAQNESWGKCSMLTSGLVSSSGWCGSWSKKA